MSAKPRILLLFTGGTISMTIVPGRGAIPSRGGREILATVKGIEAHAEIEIEDFDRLPGPHWTPSRMEDLAREIDRRLAEASLAGAVVTHGTDTLEETAFFLDLVLKTSKPVVLTGAMKTFDDPVWDGPGNLLGAIRTAAAPGSAGRGVLVAMDDTVHAARHVEKGHTEAFSAFTSGDAGPVAVVDWDGVHFRVAPGPRLRAATDRLEPEVALVPTGIGIDSRPLRAALEDGARGIVIEAMGRGNVPPAMIDGVRAARDAGVPVVIASRCHRGRTAPRYGYEGGGSTLRELGVVFSGGLPASKARILLMALLGAGKHGEAIREAFEGTPGAAC